ncbi:hypothetical protein K227x_53560 [Rubripirellula lacrimiformis]|uniref:PilZ domain-containing protein n=1 Tax=Rubripirellula lacrimiformis TaxID=1930273 RepID=A0A517NIH4_9BACT|nr:hypothetical protein K227x_53560 [Rubripirellula lacrimiformis]
MLGEAYSRDLQVLITSLPQTIRLPPSHERFFELSGPSTPYENNTRRAVRTNIRARGVLVPEHSLHAVPRNPVPSTIFTKDFSKVGFGFIADQQYYPGEVVRAILATFWLRIEITQCRRIGDLCYECGGTLVSQHAPSPDAFSFLSSRNP